MIISDIILQNITKHGVAKANKWIVRTTLPLAAQNNTLFNAQTDSQLINSNFRIDLGCEQISIPGRSFGLTEERLHNYLIKNPFTTTFEDINAIFRCSEDMFERKFFDAWINLIQNQFTRDYNYYRDFVTDIEILQLDNSGENIVYGIKLIDAYPVNVAAIEADQSSVDSYHKQGVTLTYRYWKHLNVIDNSYTTGKAHNSTIFDPVSIVENIFEF